MITLYHGTSSDAARHLVENGWQPHVWGQGGQCGNTAYLYLTNFPENAQWYSDEKQDGVVVELSVEIEDLIVDPEDGIGETVEEELNQRNGLPGCVALRNAIPADRIRFHDPTLGPAGP